MNEPSPIAREAAKQIGALLRDPCAGDESAPSFDSIIQSAIDRALAAQAEQIAARDKDVARLHGEIRDLRTQLNTAKQELAEQEKRHDTSLLQEVEQWKQRAQESELGLAALLNDLPMGNGEYVHSVHCNASRSLPVGNDMCSCSIGKRIKEKHP